MSRNETARPAIGLDIGTSRIVAACQSETETKFNVQLNAFVNIPHSKMTESVLAKEGIPHSIEGEEILVHGTEAERFADLLNKDTRRTMTRGVLNPDEPDSARLIRAIISQLVGKGEKGQKLCFTVPAAPLGAEEELTYHEATLRQMLSGMGYEVKSINEGMAVGYAELESTNYTGVGISCGGGLCNVCFSYLSMPVVSFSIPKAGDFIDASSAAVVGERANRVRLLKEQSFHLTGENGNKLNQVLSVYYDDMIQALVNGLKNAFQRARNLPKLARPIPLVLSGGSAVPPGFRERFEKALRSSDVPLEISEVRMAADPLTATARGALVAALCDM
jgi:hypothetical protein